MTEQLGRREFVKKLALSGATIFVLRNSKAAWSYQANDKLNLAFVGAGGRGAALIDEFANLGENIVALCDVDWRMAEGSFKKFPNAKRYYDFRKMLDEMQNQIDAVVVSTADHTHAIASIAAMKLGKHVYCEKPLTYCIYEARMMCQIAENQKVATQMGNQGMASNWTRNLIEIIRSGAIGHVREVHLWTDRPIWPQGIDRPKDTPPVPKELDWDLWLGPAPYRPYHPVYHPFSWRGWIDFGTGALGDIGCHAFPLPFLALNLGYPTSVLAISSGHNGETFPKWSIVHYEFPSRGDLPPVRLTWYDGGQRPSADLLKDILKGEQIPDNGHLFIGDKGVMFNGRLLPADKFRDYKPPEPTLPRAPKENHYLEWVQACKTGSKTMSNFGFASLVTEVVLLGNVALLTGEKIEFEPLTMKAKGCPEADRYIRREYRKGWTL
ncbi:MAG: Gfo/Idh/MocA family oxidoreductase [Armatimonadetes bacterium]|nr:Gfo/Idh/MocA family oxidoreductase [Armatimonadota bacterium]MDW8028770.1 Gfo/Idh/MocA family oxidoreductase [Armatimonadota bacterium]